MKFAARFRLIACAAAATLACGAHADELIGTLKKIHDEGVVTLSRDIAAKIEVHAKR